MGIHTFSDGLATQLVVEECLGGCDGASGAAAVGPGDSRDPVGRCVSKCGVGWQSRLRFARSAMIRPRGSSPQTLQVGVGVGSSVAEEVVHVVSRGDRGAIRFSARRARIDDRIDLFFVAESAVYDEALSSGSLLLG